MSNAWRYCETCGIGGGAHRSGCPEGEVSDKPNIDERAVEMEDLVYLAPDRPERLRALRERLTEFDKWAADAGVAAERAHVRGVIEAALLIWKGDKQAALALVSVLDQVRAQ